MLSEKVRRALWRDGALWRALDFELRLDDHGPMVPKPEPPSSAWHPILDDAGTEGVALRAFMEAHGGGLPAQLALMDFVQAWVKTDTPWGEALVAALEEVL